MLFFLGGMMINKLTVEKFVATSKIKQKNGNLKFAEDSVINKTEFYQQIENNRSKYLLHNGFCPVSLINKNGAAFLGNVKHVVIYQESNNDNDENDNNQNSKNKQIINTENEQQDNQFACFDSESLLHFAESPSTYNIDALFEQCLKRPELINLINLNDHICFENISCQPVSSLLSNQLVSIEQLFLKNRPLLSSAPTMKSIGTSTPVHFIESNIDENYEWNEWNMRKQALQIVNMRLKQIKTHSCQTDKSHFRRDNGTQYWLKQPLPDGTMPGTEAQTGIDRSTNVPITKKYIAGLRGKPNDKVTVVSLTFDPPVRRHN